MDESFLAAAGLAVSFARDYCFKQYTLYKICQQDIKIGKRVPRLVEPKFLQFDIFRPKSNARTFEIFPKRKKWLEMEDSYRWRGKKFSRACKLYRENPSEETYLF